MNAQAAAAAAPEEKASLETLITQVLVPETVLTEHQFGARKLMLKPLPMFYARQIRALIEPYETRLNQAGKAGDNAPPVDEDVMSQAASALTKAAAVICKCYDVTLPEDQIEKEYTQPEILRLVMAQLDVGGTNDFLLLGSRNVLLLLVGGTRATALNQATVQEAIRELQVRGDAPVQDAASSSPDSQTSSSTSPSATPGTAPSTS